MEKSPLLTAVSKLVMFGEQAGFSLEQMIQLLNTGVSVETLLELIAQRLDNDVREPIAAPTSSYRWMI